jgi:hypothetical protein
LTGTTYPGGEAGKAGGVRLVFPGNPVDYADRLTDFLRHFRFFTPDAGAKLDLHPGVFANEGANAAHIDSTYDIRAFTQTGQLHRPGIISQRNIVVKAAEPNAASPKIINIYGITEIIGGGPAASTDQNHIEILTNGLITLREKTDDMRVQSITSTRDDVILFSPAAIIDALNDGLGGAASGDLPAFGTDVTGNDITMTAGNSQITGPDLAENKSGRGGIGTPGNFLEINGNANAGEPDLGVLNATDTASNTTGFNINSPPHNPAGAGTFGIFMTETVGDMNVGLVHTKGDVSLVTKVGSGSIVDAFDDEAADAIGNSIDLNANGGSIGDPSGGPGAAHVTVLQVNDFDIDSHRCSRRATSACAPARASM